MRRPLVAIMALMTLLLARCAPAQEPMYDLLQRVYAPLIDKADPQAFPMKVWAIAQSPRRFWGAGKDHFFHWCKVNAADWLADKEAYVIQQGDQHLGNIGVYPAAGAFGTLAFGMVDFDDTANLPFQYELLQGVVTFRILARQQDVEFKKKKVDELIEVIFEHYGKAATSGKSATELLKEDKWVQDLFKEAKTDRYGDDLKDYVDARGRFFPRITNSKGPKEILRPGMQHADAIAAGLAAAIGRSPATAALLRYRTVEEFRRAIKDIAIRTQVRSGGSQGMRKYLVLLDRPMLGIRHDLIIYLKQQAPTAAERSGLIPLDPRKPAQRFVEHTLALMNPPPFLIGWCEMDGVSYWVTLKEPWSEELGPKDVEDVKDLKHAARIFATATGASHARSGKGAVIASRLTPQLAEQIKRLSEAYVRQLYIDYEQFRSDPRTVAHVKAVAALIDGTP